MIASGGLSSTLGGLLRDQRASEVGRICNHAGPRHGDQYEAGNQRATQRAQGRYLRQAFAPGDHAPPARRGLRAEVKLEFV